MADRSKHSISPVRGLATVVRGGCVWRSGYDALKSKNQQLQQQTTALTAQVDADKTQIARLQGAIKYTVDGDHPFCAGQLADASPRTAGYRQSGGEVSADTAEQALAERLYRQRAGRSGFAARRCDLEPDPVATARRR